MTLLMKASVTQVAMIILLTIIMILLLLIIIIIWMRMIMVKTLTVIRTILITMTYPTPTLPSQELRSLAVAGDIDSLAMGKRGAASMHHIIIYSM